jgi:hypothetical protein
MWAQVQQESTPPRALLLGNQKQLQLIINRQELADMGAWIAYFNLGLETGLKETTAYLEQVDYKIEDGKLFRYEPTYEKGWEVLEEIKTEHQGKHTIVTFPKPHLAHIHGPLYWRVVLFPHDRN